MGKTCCASNCTNRFQKGNGLSFHRFALTGDRGERWLQALQRENFIPNEYTWICSAHFQTGKPSTDENHPDYVPNIFNCSAPQQKRLTSEERKQCIRMTAKRKTKERICKPTGGSSAIHGHVESLITTACEKTCRKPAKRLQLQDVIDIANSNSEDADSCEELCEPQTGSLHDIVDTVYDTTCSTCELLMTENLNLVLENSSLRQSVQELKEEIRKLQKLFNPSLSSGGGPPHIFKPKSRNATSPRTYNLGISAQDVTPHHVI